jgi:hypothetical protein
MSEHPDDRVYAQIRADAEARGIVDRPELQCERGLVWSTKVPAAEPWTQDRSIEIPGGNTRECKPEGS